MSTPPRRSVYDDMEAAAVSIQAAFRGMIVRHPGGTGTHTSRLVADELYPVDANGHHTNILRHVQVNRGIMRYRKRKSDTRVEARRQRSSFFYKNRLSYDFKYK